MEEDPYDVALAETGCASLNEAVILCYSETKDWRKCKKELDAFKKCYELYQQKISDKKLRQLEAQSNQKLIEKEQLNTIQRLNSSCEWSFQLHGPLFSCKFNPNSNYNHIAAVAGEAGYISIINTNEKSTDPGNMFISYPIEINEWIAHENSIFDLEWIDGGRKVASASGDQSLSIWDVKKQTRILRLDGHLSSVKCITSHPHNSISGSRDGVMRVWDLRMDKHASNYNCTKQVEITDTLKIPKGRKSLTKTFIQSITCIKFLPINSHILVSSAAPSKFLQFWDIRYERKPLLCKELNSTSSNIAASHFSIDSIGNSLYSVCTDNSIKKFSLFDSVHGPEEEWKNENYRSNSFFIKTRASFDDNFIISGCVSGGVQIWSTNTSKLIRTLDGHFGDVNDVDINEAGDKIKLIIMEIAKLLVDKETETFNFRAEKVFFFKETELQASLDNMTDGTKRQEQNFAVQHLDRNEPRTSYTYISKMDNNKVSASTAGLVSEDLRRAQVLSERRRRALMRDGFRMLKSKIPEHGLKKKSKAATLKSAAVYIRLLSQQINEIKRELEYLSAEFNQLSNRI